MKLSTTLKIFLALFLFIETSHSNAQTALSDTTQIIFKTKSGKSILVKGGQIFINKMSVYKFREDLINYKSPYNKIIEDSLTTLLFIAKYADISKVRMEGFKITQTKAVKIVDAIASAISNFDNDGFLEFGGYDFTEQYPNQDSMYYIPTEYYEIRNGKVYPDLSLIKKKDILINGVYLKKPLDKEGNCCKVIPKPKRQKW